ncbi:hypothetical protein N8D56_26350 (plasmid) [Devosia sp. A8/3-2]|nr:hypothetical protein N8D56_26350 [Devosia sp. A8/3-2]
MRIYISLALAALSPLPAMANCIPPWKTHFACSIPEQDARAEFCRIADTKANPNKKEGYYTYSVGTEPTELYFETDSIWFSTKDTDIDHPTDLTMSMGYARDNWIYAFVITEDSREADGVRDAEVRVYSSTDDFTSSTKDTEVVKLHCDSSTILADLDSIAP